MINHLFPDNSCPTHPHTIVQYQGLTPYARTKPVYSFFQGLEGCMTSWLLFETQPLLPLPKSYYLFRFKFDHTRVRIYSLTDATFRTHDQTDIPFKHVTLPIGRNGTVDHSKKISRKPSQALRIANYHEKDNPTP